MPPSTYLYIGTAITCTAVLIQVVRHGWRTRLPSRTTWLRNTLLNVVRQFGWRALLAGILLPGVGLFGQLPEKPLSGQTLQVLQVLPIRQMPHAADQVRGDAPQTRRL